MIGPSGFDACLSTRPHIQWAIGSPQINPLCLGRCAEFGSSPAGGFHSQVIDGPHLPVSASSLCSFISRVDILEEKVRWRRADRQRCGTAAWTRRLNCHYKDVSKELFGLGHLEFCICENFVVHTLVRKPTRGHLKIRAGGSSSEQASLPPSYVPKKQQGIFSAVIDFPRSIWRQVVNPLSNFGFGKRSVWEGGVGLFVISGVVLLAVTVSWLKGYQLRSRSQKYQAVIEFSKACGITVGTPVRIRGVDVGNVVSVKPSLESIDVVVQVLDAKVVIPRNSLVEVNQSGLLMETLIDITPRHPLPEPKVGPIDQGCSEEGLIVCDRQKIKGEQGVNLDELIGIFTRLAREVDAIGITQVYELADRIGRVVEEAKPLLSKVEALAGGIEPLLKEVQDGGLLKELENLAKVLTEASSDLRRLNSSVLTTENTEMLRQSVTTLTKTLKNIESISGDVCGLTGDAATRYNLKQLIESLSRLLAD